MTRVFVGAGSNIDKARNIVSGVRMLRERFGALRVSPLYETPAVGFAGDDFYNLVASFETARAPDEVARALRDIERRHGRKRGGARFAPRSLDLDLLLYGELVCARRGLPHADIARYPFALRPLADLAGELRHPALGRRYAELWAEMARNGGGEMRRVDCAGLREAAAAAA